MMVSGKKDFAQIQKSLSVFPFSLVLRGASFLYSIVIKARRGGYRLGVITQRQLPGFVVSVGNIAVGGTGKTPMVLLLAQWARAKGYNACVLSRGYGGNFRGKVLEVSDGDQIKVSWKECGDEPYLIAKRSSGVPVVVSKKRYLGGIYAAKKFGSNFFILDDGFQHLALKRNFDIVLLDASKPFGNGRLLPWGLLREPKESIGRAHALVLTRFSNNQTCKKAEEEIARKFPQKPLFMSIHRPHKLIFPTSQTIFEPSYISRKKVAAFAGIGNPSSFENTLASLGARLVQFNHFPDHHLYLGDELKALTKEAKALGAEMLLTTEKDWIRVGSDFKAEVPLGYLVIVIEIKREKLFFDLIERFIHRAYGI